MATKIAINGFGRIGRSAFKIALAKNNVEVVAINDIAENATLAHLLKYDTAYGKYDKPVAADDAHLVVDGKKIPVFAEKEPSQLPWKDLGVEAVLECTGIFRTKELASKHLDAGAQRVVISAPAKGDDPVGMYVLGVNAHEVSTEDAVLSNASCTTNSISPVMKVLAEEFGVLKASLTTVHSYTADQRLQDAPHTDLRRARAAAMNIIPTTTGAARAAAKTIPALKNIFDGFAIRVPTITVSLSDITCLVQKKTTVEDINAAFRTASESKELKGILGVTDEPLVSSDFIGNTHSSIVDLGLTNVVDGDLVKVVTWYDNEWAYALRLVELAAGR